MAVFTVESLGFSDKGQTILQAIDFSVQEGERLTLVGPSGSGKSSILKLLGGLISPSQGQVLYQGSNLADLDMPLYRQEVSYCFQQPVLFGKTVADNLAFPFEVRQLAFDHQRAVQALRRVNLSETFLNKNITDLSGGEKQRVALVRNLLFEPKVLLLDEITVGLDAGTKEVVHDLIDESHASGKTIIEVTHDATEIAAAEKVLQIEGGRLVL